MDGASLGTAFVEVRPDLDRFNTDLKNGVEQAGKSASDTLKTVLTVGAFTVAAKEIIGAASDLQQAVGGTTAVFGESQAAVSEWAKGADEAAGLSERAARQLTSQIGGLLKGFGFAKDEAAATSIELAQLGADLAATFGGTTQEAVEALAAALRGETDPLERFGISLNQAAINAKAMELGLAKSATEVTGNAKAQAALALITERSADAQGQFGREADTAAGQLERTKAKIENTAASIGSDLLPVVAQAAELVGFLTEGFAALPQPVQTAALALGAIAIVGPKVASGLGSAVSVAKEIPGTFTKGRDAVTSFATSHQRMLDGLAGAATVFAAAQAASQLYQGAIHDLDDDVRQITDAQREAAKSDSYDQLADRIGRIRTEVEDLDRTRENSSALWDADQRDQMILGANALDRTREALESLRLVAETMSVVTGDNKDKTLAWLQAQQEAGNYFPDAGVAIAAYTGHIDDSKLSTDDAKLATDGWAQSIRDAADAQKAATDPLFAAIDAQERLQDAQKNVEDSSLKAFFAQQKYNEEVRIHGRNSVEAKAALRDLEDAQRDQERASIDAAQAGLTSEDALLRLAAAAKQTGGIDEAKAALERLVAQGVITRGDADLTIAKFGEVDTKAAETIYDRNMRVNLDTTAAIGSLEDLKAQIFAAGLEPTNPNGVQFTPEQLSGILAIAGGPTGEPKAAGGRVSAGTTYPVNEYGIEGLRTVGGTTYLTPGTDGTVIPANQMGSPSGGFTINGGVTIVSSDPEKAGRAFLRSVRREAAFAGGR